MIPIKSARKNSDQFMIELYHGYLFAQQESTEVPAFLRILYNFFNFILTLVCIMAAL